MGFQVPITISDAIRRIRERRLLLPAIQREFVWRHSKIDKYYEFLRVYRERYEPQNPEFNTDGHVDFDAVLDGQQRLTALYIGLCGTYAYYKGRVWWQNDEYAVPTRQLYLRDALAFCGT